MNRASFFTAAFAATSLLYGQSALSGPTQGMTFDSPSQSLRAVVGSYGSAVLGPALLSGLEFASMAPLGNHGVACFAGQCVLVSGVGSETVLQTPIADQADLPEATAWSADGQVAAIYSRSGQWIRVLKVSGESGPQTSLASLGGALVAVAVNSNGAHVVFALAGEHPGVLEMTADGNFVPVMAAQHPTALTYSGETLYVLDETRILEKSADGIAQSWSMDGVQDGVGVQAGRDASGRDVLYVAGRGDHALFAFDRSNHSLTEQIPLTFAPSQMQASGPGSYLLTARASEDELLWSFTTGRGVFFVPVTPLAATGGLPQRKVRR